MAVKKNTTPPAGVEAAAGEVSAVENAGAAATAAPVSDEEKIRQATERKLEERGDDKAVKLSTAVARANGLEGELKKERAAREAAQKEVVELKAALAAATTAAKNAGTAIAGLPENARQLNESVTAAVIERGGKKPRRASLKATDVLLVTADDAEVDALQQELGLQATVYKVSQETLTDLEQSGFLHP